MGAMEKSMSLPVAADDRANPLRAFQSAIGNRQSEIRTHSAIGNRKSAILILAALIVSIITGCARPPKVIPSAERITIDRKDVEYPPGFALRAVMTNLTAPTAIAHDPDGTLFIADHGGDGNEPHIFALRPDGTSFNIYPVGRRVPFLQTGFQLYG